MAFRIAFQIPKRVGIDIVDSAYKFLHMASRSEIALAIVGSHTTAIAAELVAELEIYPEFVAISRRGATTLLPVVLNGDEWGKRLKHPGLLGAGKLIQGFLDEIGALTGGRSFDCFIHHSKDPFSQLLSDHPLCRKYFYIEEGFTALTGGTFGRPKKRPRQKLIWNLRSRIFYRGRINRYRDFFDTSAPNYGGVFALSKGGFKNFPGRTQLESRHLSLAVPLPSPLMIFLDSQYFLGNCTEENYVRALCDSLREITGERASAAIKFHPAESDPERKRRIMEAVRSLGGINNLIDLPASFVGERVEFSADATVVVGTSALGLYLGERGFQTFTFAPRIAPSSAKYAKVLEGIPQEFREVCRSI
jgi:hypothetical protein